MISEYIDSFDEFYKLDLSFSEFYSQHYGDYRHVDCEVGNPFEIFDENGHKIREKRIERIERENICFENVKFFCNIFSKKIFNIVYLLFIIYNDII